MTTDESYMREALKEARKGWGLTSPNPMVGAVVVRDGVIVGRRPGIKGWLQTEIPALYLKYKTVMAYKAAAKRMRQVLDIRDPLPLSAALGETLDYGADEIQGRASGGRETGNGEEGTGNGEWRRGNGKWGRQCGAG